MKRPVFLIGREFNPGLWQVVEEELEKRECTLLDYDARILHQLQIGFFDQPPLFCFDLTGEPENAADIARDIRDSNSSVRILLVTDPEPLEHVLQISPLGIDALCLRDEPLPTILEMLGLALEPPDASDAAGARDSKTQKAGSGKDADSSEQQIHGQFLAVSSPLIQAALQWVASKPGQRNWVLHGPPGAEFELAAREILHLHGQPVGLLQLADTPQSTTAKPCLILPATETTPSAIEAPAADAHQFVVIHHADALEDWIEKGWEPFTLPPLADRIEDIAFYAERFAPALFTLARQPRSPLPLDESDARRLLFQDNPGEFADLWQQFNQWALGTQFSPLDPVKDAAAAETLAEYHLRQAYENRVRERVGNDKLKYILQQLDFPQS